MLLWHQQRMPACQHGKDLRPPERLGFRVLGLIGTIVSGLGFRVNVYLLDILNSF